MRIIPGNSQALGMRQEQQDSFGFSDIGDGKFMEHSGILAVIADGMGGLAMGRDASTAAVQAILQEYTAKGPAEQISDALIRALYKANADVCKIAESNGLQGRVGTTLITVVVHQGRLYWISVGDSRLYLFRDGNLTQLTKDHIYDRDLAQKVALGLITQESADADPERNALTSYLGIDKLDKIDTNVMPLHLRVSDRVLLCSDGLYGTVSEEEMALLLADDPQTAAENLVNKALEKKKPYQDNVTVAVLACEGGGVIPKTKTSRKKKKTLGKLVALGTALMLFTGGYVLGQHNEWVKGQFQKVKAVFFKAKADQLEKTQKNDEQSDSSVAPAQGQPADGRDEKR